VKLISHLVVVKEGVQDASDFTTHAPAFAIIRERLSLDAFCRWLSLVVYNFTHFDRMESFSWVDRESVIVY